MQITLNQSEIEQAITEFVGNQGIEIGGKATKVTMVAGRGGNGNSATVDIQGTSTSKPVPTPEPETVDPAKIEFGEGDDGPELPEETEELFGQ